LRQAKILTALNERLRLEPHSCLNRTRIFSDGRQQLPRHCTKSPAYLFLPGCPAGLGAARNVLHRKADPLRHPLGIGRADCRCVELDAKSGGAFITGFGALLPAFTLRAVARLARRFAGVLTFETVYWGHRGSRR
jgi:hypothetical protein